MCVCEREIKRERERGERDWVKFSVIVYLVVAVVAVRLLRKV